MRRRQFLWLVCYHSVSYWGMELICHYKNILCAYVDMCKIYCSFSCMLGNLQCIAIEYVSFVCAISVGKDSLLILKDWPQERNPAVMFKSRKISALLQ